ncbi:MAG: tetratricopeptide repeat protein [Bryobacterales bacterium]|nr:tetratricopeptide repeat protein [Bryobacterales bacterium]
MDRLARGVIFLCLMGLVAAPTPGADAPAQVPGRAEAYYNFSMGHVYAELAAQYGNRGEYLSRAIEHFKAALEADPTAAVISEELAGLYIQAGKVRDAVSELEARLSRNPNAIDARRILGRIYLNMIGDPQAKRINEEMVRRALEQYQKIVEIDPKDIESWLLLGRLHRVSQNSAEAEKAFKQALELEPSNEDAMSELALVYANLGDNRRALEMWEKAAASKPSRRNLVALAGAYEDLRDYANAVAVLERAVEAEPDNTDLQRMLGQNLMMAGKLDEALRVFTEVAEEDPKDTQALMQIFRIHRERRDLGKAREALERAKAVDPESVEIRYSEVTLLGDEGKRQEALAAMKKLADSSEKRYYNSGERASRVALLERLALMYRANEQYSQAVDTFRKMAETDADLAGRAAAQIVETYRAARDFSRAAAEADAAASNYPNDRMVILTRATVLADLGRADEALAEAKKLFRAEGDKDAWFSLAQIHERSKNYSEMGRALDAYEKLVSGEEDRATLLFMRGAMYERTKRYDEAEAEFRKALALDPDNAAVLNYLGYMLADRDVRLEEAHKMISRALELDPDNGAYLDSMGWVYFRMGQLAEAETYLRRALEEVPHDATVREHLGDVLARRGDLKGAVAEWQRSIQEWESSAPAEKDAAEIAKINGKLESAKVRLAQEASSVGRKP